MPRKQCSSQAQALARFSGSPRTSGVANKLTGTLLFQFISMNSLAGCCRVRQPARNRHVEIQIERRWERNVQGRKNGCRTVFLAVLCGGLVSRRLILVF